MNVTAQTNIYTYTGATQTYTVPAGVESVTVDARGGCGGSFRYFYEGTDFTSDSSRGGYGARVVCSLAVTPGQILHVYVGGNGDTSGLYFYDVAPTSYSGADTAYGGWNGGGSNYGYDSDYYLYTDDYFYGNIGGGGGGASDIRIGGTALTNRVIVAGGGGGASDWCGFALNENRGGDGGGLTGENGYNCNSYTASYDGGGGTQSAGGTGATWRSCGADSGTLGIGGSTDNCGYYIIYASNGGGGGGGGGGGYYGGGAGWVGGGGGGGSSYTDSALTTGVVHTRGYNTTLADTVFISVNCSGGTINGVASICAGNTTTLSDTVAGSSGTWSSSNMGVATVGPSSGIVSGVSGGTATITYSVMAYCGSVYSIAIVTVNSFPAVITGAAMVCVGATTTLYDAVIPPTGGITWSSGSTGIATVVSSTGVVMGLAPGTSAVTYTPPTGCGSATAIVTVNPLPLAVTGTTFVCQGATTTIGDATSGGTWSSTNTGIATMVTLTGNVSGVTAGTTIISYTLPTSCAATATVTVNPLPPTITGVTSLCAGATTTLSNSITGGTWSSSNTTTATINAAGTAFGVAPGTSTITYTAGSTGCAANTIVAVNPVPLAITGISNVCSGETTTLSDATSGGTWSSSSTYIATVSGSGVVSGVAAAAVTISYKLGTGCTASKTVTINTAPLPIGGTPSLCAGGTSYLYDAVPGGTWSISNASVATVDSFGTVTGISAGTDTITYAIGSCTATAVVTVNPLPYLVIGPPAICVGQTTTLSDVATGGTWTTDSAAVYVGLFSGDVDGISAGVATITYTLSTGCSVTKTMTVDTSPGAITGTAQVCAGLTAILTDAGGGSWTSSNTAIATIGTAGIVSGITAGTSVITYSLGASCSTTAIVTVNPLPHAIGGVAVACAGATTALTSSGSGTWSPATGGIATVGPVGVVSGIAGGTATITFTLPTGCATTSIVTINPLPSAIGGTLAVCPSATTALNDLTTDGTWSSGSTTTATIGTASGIMSGVAPGTSVITYTAPGTGCSRAAVVTINPLPALPTAAAICAGATTTLSDAISGGTWSSCATSFATITATGTVSGLMGGTATISYTLGTGCARTAIVTINPIPTIIGPTAECVGATMTETPTPTGGTWSPATGGIVTINATGGITGVAAGTTAITYTSSAGCKATRTITISLSPTAILGPSTVCANDTMSLSDAVGGGVWSSSNTAVATIGSLTPLVSGVVAGTTIITYSLGTTGCTVTKIITANPVPIAIGSAGLSMCIGAATTLTDATTGGMWSSSATAIATVIATGAVTGAAAGTETVSYTLSATGCSANAVITVNPTPSAIIGFAQVCAGSTTVLSDLITGGTWNSSNTSIANIDPAGNVTGATSGTATITYSLGAGCAVTKMVTVNPISVITGSLGVCVGATTTLADAVTGGTWSSSATGIAAISSPATGGITGVLAGTSTITYTTAAGCTATAVVTVNLAPSAINGILHVCAGATTSLGNTAGGGTWTSSNTVIATISGTGVITGITHGTTTITYSLGSGCTVTAVLTVNVAPEAIMASVPIATGICVGSSTPLTSATTGGTWSITPTAIATLSGAETVTGLTSGTAVVSYTLSDGCTTSVVITVNPLPTPISGGGDICVGATETLTSGISGGTWSSSSTGIATANPLTGDITGMSPGSATITYTLPTGCSAYTQVTVNAAPPVPLVSGSDAMSVCIGSIISLSDPPGTGIWSSSNTGIATITTTGIVSGIAFGTATISYTVGGCPATVVVTVNSLPGAISGSTHVCVGSATTLSDLPDGGTWSIATTSVAAISSPATGGITGIAAGTATVAYSTGTGCTVTTTVTVDALPSPIGGVTEVCKGYTTSLTDPSSGVWSSSNTAIATITGSGVVSGAAGGPSIISYTNSAGCAATRLVTVIAVPPILGVSNICAFTGSLPLYDSAAGGFWTSTLASISSSGVVTPYSAGVVGITYTLPLGCYIIASLTVNPLPGPVVGLNHLCLGSTISMSDTSSGGTWSSSNTAVAAISSPATGGIEGSSAGVSIISYTLGTGCATTETITVDVSPSAGTITGLSVVCVGADIALSDAALGGAWSASNTNASVGSTGSLSGVVSGVSAGADVISYTVSNSCGSAFAAKTITINPLPVAGTITGASTVCTGDSIVLADLATGGGWSSSAPATTAAGGIVAGAFAGTDTIKYTVTNSCGIAFAAKTVTLIAQPNAGIINGADSICIGGSFAFTDTAAGGLWSSSNDLISISSSGLISAISAGVDTITYSVTNTCGAATAKAVVAIRQGPLAGVITGGGIICSGTKDTLTGTPAGGDWSSSNGNAVVTNIPTGIVITGVTAGADTITYTLTNECGQALAVLPITVYTTEECDSIAATPNRSSVPEQLHIWPNPNDGLFTVLLSSITDAPVHLTITNILGEKIKDVTTATNQPATIKLNNAAGIYFVTASTPQGNYIAKIIFTQ